MPGPMANGAPTPPAEPARPGGIELSVVVPCLNEEANLPELVTRVLGVFERGGFEGELIVVDDGSTDRSRDVVATFEAAHPGRVRGCHHPENRGIAEAWRTGALAARGRLVATIDADLQYQPEDLLRLRRALYDHSVDIVQGWRSPTGRRRDDRYTLSRGFNALLNGVFSMRLRDNKSGFVVCGREVLLDVLEHRGSYAYFQSFIMVAAHAKGYAYREVETLFEERRQGTSFLAGGNALKASARSLVDLGKAAWEYRLGPRRAPRSEARPARTLAEEARWRAYMASFDRSHWMITREVERHYESLSASQWLGPADLGELVDEKLRRLVRHAYRSVPFYRERMRAAGLRPEDIRGRGDLPKLGFVTKKDIRENLYFDILSEDHDKDQVLRITTSGSTGEPFVCFADRAQLEHRWAATLRAQEWTGYRFGDPTVRLWHQTLGMTKDQALRERLDAKLSNRTFVPVFDLADGTLPKVLETIQRARPRLLDGYAEALDLIARFTTAKGGFDLDVGAVMSSAQTLPEGSRRAIERAFGCRVFDKYGSREFSGIAYECDAHAGHHVVAEGYIVEVLKDGEPARPGEVGEVVITDLNNYCMPFVRYRIGDLAVAMDPNERCACGRAAPRIGDIQGRVQSIIVGEGKRFLPGTFFAHYFKELHFAIQRYQVHQTREGAISLSIVKGLRYSDDVLDEVLATLRAHLGQGMQIDVVFVDRIELVRTGKILPAVSALAFDFQSARLEPAAVTSAPAVPFGRS